MQKIDFTEVIYSIRKEKGFTQAQMAKKLGFTESSYQAYETGLRQPSHLFLLRLAEYGGVSMDHIYRMNKNREYVVYLDGLTEDGRNSIIGLVGIMREQIYKKEKDNAKK